MAGTTADGKPVQGPSTNALGQNYSGDSVTLFGVCSSVSGSTASMYTATVVMTLANSGNTLSVPGIDAKGPDPRRVVDANSPCHATGVVTAISGSGPKAVLTVLLSNSQTSVLVNSQDTYATQSA